MGMLKMYDKIVVRLRFTAGATTLGSIGGQRS